ncbi:hypothetical protein D041_0635A, partial [Vibrio parahaemolyticus EKP-008]
MQPYFVAAERNHHSQFRH